MNLHMVKIVVVIWVASEIGLNLFKRAGAGAVSKDRQSCGLILLVSTAAAMAGTNAALRLTSCALPWPKGFFVLGTCLFFPGVLLRWYSIIHLGRFFTVNVAIASDHRVVDTGPYRYLRHPSYTGSLLAIAGFSLMLQNWAAFLVIILPIFFVTLWRIHVEEAALLGAMGDGYRSYMLRTKRLIPLIY